MHSDNKDIFAKEIFTTKSRPFYFYLTATLWIVLFILFLIVFQVRELDKESTIATTLVFLFLAIYVYLLFGRYLATIIFYDHKIEVKYLFPWNSNIEFRFENLKEIEFKEYDFLDRLTRAWYRGGKWLYLKNELDEACQFKYTIDTSENTKLLKELQKRSSSNLYSP